MSKFHINQKDGTVGACRAQNGKCPFGGDEIHFTTMVAAAEAYEKSMASETMVSHSKPAKVSADSGALVPPADYEVGTRDLSSQEVLDLGKIPKLEHLYFSARSTSPVVSHEQAIEIVQALKEVELRGSSPKIRQFYTENPGTSNYDDLAKYVDQQNEGVPYTYPHKSTAELTETLVEDTKRNVLASRPFGFPEDEMSRYYMDQREAAQLKSLSIFTGKDPKVIKNEIIAAVPVERNNLEKLSDKQLAEDAKHLNGLVRLSDARKRERKNLNRELAIRRVTANPTDPDIADEAIRKGDVTRNEVISLTGSDPRPYWG